MPLNQSEEELDDRWCAVTHCPYLADCPRPLCVLERAFPSVSWRLGKRGSASQDMKTERVVAARAEHRGTNSWPWELELNRKKERSSHWYSFASFPLIANSLKTENQKNRQTMLISLVPISKEPHASLSLFPFERSPPSSRSHPSCGLAGECSHYLMLTCRV